MVGCTCWGHITYGLRRDSVGRLRDRTSEHYCENCEWTEHTFADEGMRVVEAPMGTEDIKIILLRTMGGATDRGRTPV